VTFDGFTGFIHDICIIDIPGSIMKSLRQLVLVLLAVALCAGVSSAQRNDGAGAKRQSGNWGVMRMSDSCWRVFVSSMSDEDARLFTTLVSSLKTDEAQLETLKKELREARRNQDRTAAARIQNAMKDLVEKIRREREGINRLLIKYNDAAVRTLRECHRPIKIRKDDGTRDTIRKGDGPRDTVRKGDGPRDTTKRGGGLPGDERLELKVKPVFPNPAGAGSTANVCYYITGEADVTISVVQAMLGSTTGTVLLTVNNADQAAGEHCVTLDLAGLEPGKYLIVVTAGDRKVTQNFMIGR
jgi:hypothetical protein